ncbi:MULTISPECIES: hypothetical protein [unclassified Bradyrhizobium]|uniref:hypothetical protein n=1 Tax=unclassified Bradyrhizobium TaxID=2631580 RepID=UPI002FEFE007
MSAAGTLIGEERQAREQLRAEVDALRLELAELRGRLAERSSAAAAASTPARLRAIIG